MISIEACHTIIASIEAQQSTEFATLFNCANRILAADVVADTDQPPFNKSAMDGYACRKDDIAAALKIVGVINAGTRAQRPLEKGTCYRIFTGAPVPEGADCVMMQEDAHIEASGNVVFTVPNAKQNICYKGEDSKAGDVVLKRGTRLEAQHIAVLAAYGCTQVPVFKKIKVAVFCSGSELVEPHRVPSDAFIRNSNAYQLMAQLANTGAEAEYMGIVADDLALVTNKVTETLPHVDAIFITGGASVGDFDFLPAVLKNMGANVLFSALNIQPGKPVLYGQLHNKHIFGLSGNPVSSFLQYLLVGSPILLKLTGASTYLPQKIHTTISGTLKRKKGTRQLYLPITITPEKQAVPLAFNGSGHIGALTGANGFAIVPPGANEVEAGSAVDVILF